MNPLSRPIVAAVITVAVAALTGILGYAILTWVADQDWALVASAFGGAVEPNNDPFSVPTADVAGNADAYREALLKMLREMVVLTVAVMVAAPLVWIVWFTNVKIASPKEGNKGAGLWWGLLLATTIACGAIAIFAIFQTPSGAIMTARATWAVGAVLVALPIVAFALVSRLTTPNAARMSLPF